MASAASKNEANKDEEEAYERLLADSERFLAESEESKSESESEESVLNKYEEEEKARIANMSPEERAVYLETRRLAAEEQDKMDNLLKDAESALSVNGVFIKTKSKIFPSVTKQKRLVIIDEEIGFEWFDEGNSDRKIGSIPLVKIVRASDAGTWGKLFGVDIFHPGIEKNNTYLWCESVEERDKVIATVNALVAQEAAKDKEGGNKNRKTIIKYRKRRTIRKNKKGTRQRKNRTRTRRHRKNRTRTSAKNRGNKMR